MFPTPRWSGPVCEESRDQKRNGIGLRQTRIDGSLQVLGEEGLAGYAAWMACVRASERDAGDPGRELELL